ncbi:hypothetical protein SUGI_0640490 [Cryptomeria japonica]|nr:hypothetical protein SUGI_0640490 [Cryptomeria japonica]
MVDVMLSTVETEGQTVSRVDIKAMILDMVNAGIETSSTLVEWAMSELLRNPETLARTQKEMESAVGRKSRVKESDVVKETPTSSASSSAHTARGDGRLQRGKIFCSAKNTAVCECVGDRKG